MLILETSLTWFDLTSPSFSILNFKLQKSSTNACEQTGNRVQKVKTANTREIVDEVLNWVQPRRIEVQEMKEALCIFYKQLVLNYYDWAQKKFKDGAAFAQLQIRAQSEVNLKERLDCL